MNNFESLLEKIQQTKKLDFGDVLNESIELFKKTWLQGFVLLLLTLVVILPLIVALFIPLIGLISAQDQIGEEAFLGFLGGMSILYILFIVFGVFVVGTISFALNAGFYRIMQKLDVNETVATSDFFFFVKMQYLGKCLVLMLVSVLIAIVSMAMCYLPFIYTIVPLSFLVLVFAFNPDLTVSEIIKVSFKLANKHWLISFGLIVVSSILAQIVGYLACGFGLLFTATFVYHPLYIIYKNVICYNEVDAIDEIGIEIE